MRRTYLILPVITLLVIGFFFLNTTTDNEIDRSENESLRDSPKERWEWQQMLLKDPATGEIPENMRAKELAFAKRLSEQHKLNKNSPGITNGLSAIASWESNGPINIGGRTRALAYDISDPNIILAGGVSGGMWRSTDGGAVWSRVTELSQLASVTCVAQDTRNGKTNTWYYGTGERIGNSADFPGDGIFKSTDNGESWTQLSSTAEGTVTNTDVFSYIYRVAIDESNTEQDEVYAAADGEIMRSLDGGNSWENVIGSGGSFGRVETDLIVTSTGVVYATFSSNANTPGIWRSTTGNPGEWTDITPEDWSDFSFRTVLAAAPSNENIIYFLAEILGDAPSFWKYTYQSGDGSGAGGVWEDRSNSFPDGSGDIEELSLQGGYNMVVAVKPDDPDIVLVGGVSLLRSTNGFADNTQTTHIGGYGTATLSGPLGDYPDHFPDQHALVFHPSNPDLLICGNDGGVFRTDDITEATITWTPLNNRYVTVQYYGIAIDYSSDSKIVTGGMQDRGNFLINPDISDEAVSMDMFGIDGSMHAIADNREYYYFGAQLGTIFRANFTDEGELSNFAEIHPQLSGLLFVNPYTMDPSNSEIIYYAGGESLLRTNSASTEDGNGWTTLSNSEVNLANITAIGVSKANSSNVVYYGTQNGQIYRLDNANTGDPNKIDIWSGKGLPNGYVNNITVDKTNSDNALVIFSSYNVMSIYYTSDAGNSWTPVAGNLEENPDGTGNGPSVRWASIMNYNGATYYLAATSTGIYSTTNLDGMNTQWTPEAETVIGNVVCPMILSRDSDGFIAVGSHGNGLFTANIDLTSVDDQNEDVPNTFRLAQNYPNPFNPSTTIRFSVPKTADVALNIYDSNGELVNTLVNKQMGEGSYEATWNSRNSNGFKVASGVYFYQLISESFIETKKMMLLK